ncbi:hypothetical protein AJ80_06750 [Polytolypa hystricis UAMH7299]|uniref:Uncharacterized protein n=1 Tax=Polytolypa hystricis (strain UAMH7299) TaxID=1447883 RepID=A0A2B7XTM3_POLH7|nr:hypothetical protein AJ80_06750 [Polytolypa hystricis UAMH7299]
MDKEKNATKKVSQPFNGQKKESKKEARGKVAESRWRSEEEDEDEEEEDEVGCGLRSWMDDGEGREIIGKEEVRGL